MGLRLDVLHFTSIPDTLTLDCVELWTPRLQPGEGHSAAKTTNKDYFAVLEVLQATRFPHLFFRRMSAGVRSAPLSDGTVVRSSACPGRPWTPKELCKELGTEAPRLRDCGTADGGEKGLPSRQPSRTDACS